MFLKNSRNNELLLLTDTKLGGSGPSMSQKPFFVKKKLYTGGAMLQKNENAFCFIFLKQL